MKWFLDRLREPSTYAAAAAGLAGASEVVGAGAAGLAQGGWIGGAVLALSSLGAVLGEGKR